MIGISFLDFQYSLSRNNFSRKLSRPSFSLRDRQNSGPPIFELTLDELRGVFDRFDVNKDGKISQAEYKSVLKALPGSKWKKNTGREVNKIFEIADLDMDGFIDFNEFVEVQRKAGGVRTGDIQCAFQTFDANNDGKISAEEVLEVLRSLGERCSLEDCRNMVRAVDNNGDGLIDMDEFTAMMTQSSTFH